MSDAVTLIDQCGDERLRAELLLQAAPYAFERPMVGPKGEAALKQAELAARRVMQPDLEAVVAHRFADADAGPQMSIFYSACILYMSSYICIYPCIILTDNVALNEHMNNNKEKLNINTTTIQAVVHML